jgi:sugar phosphate isomerase/epimerase
MFRNLSTDSLGVSGRQSEIIEMALSFGFKGVDLDLADFQEQVKVNGLPRARRLLDSAKLKIGTFRLPLVWDDTDEIYQQGLQSLGESLKLAAEVGATRAVTSLAPANDTRPYHENFEFHRRRLTELGEVLAPHGMRLGIELLASAAARKDRAYQFIYTLDALAMLVSMIRSTNVGIVLDPWQIHAGGGTLDDVQKIGGTRIVAVYLSDAPADVPPAELTDEQRLLPGETGAIDSAAVLTRLAEWGYDGPVTPRAHKSRVVAMRREQVVKLAGQRLDEAWKSAGLNAAGRLAPAKK